MNRGRIAASFVVLLALSTGCGDGHSGDPPPAATATVTAQPVATPSATQPRPSATSTLPPTRTATVIEIEMSPTAVPTAAPPTATPSVTLTPSVTATPEPPEVTFFGVARADDLLQTTSLVDAEGRPIYERAQGQGMTLVLEARRGSLPLAEAAYDPFGGLPGAQIIVSRPLGDGSVAVCDYDPPIIGGVPATVPLVFSSDPSVVDAINDFGCRVNDGTGVPLSRTSNNACTRDARAEFVFADPTSERQFCLPIARAWAFPPGDTIVAARVQDVRGNASAPREIVIRVAGDVPFECDEGLGERVVTPARPGSTLLTSVTVGDATIDPWVSEPIRLCAGPDLGNGVHALSLREDAIIGFSLADGSTLCVRLVARGSDGTLDCSGGTANDVRAVQATEGDTRITVDTGLGLPSGTGAATLLVPIGVRQVGGPPSTCASEQIPVQFDGALTTATGTAEVVDGHGSPGAFLSVSGVSFDCASWQSTDGPGTLVLPAPAIDTPAGDVATVLVLKD